MNRNDLLTNCCVVTVTGAGIMQGVCVCVCACVCLRLSPMRTSMGMVKSQSKVPPPPPFTTCTVHTAAHLDAPHRQQFPPVLLKLGSMASPNSLAKARGQKATARCGRPARPLLALGGSSIAEACTGTPIQFVGKDGTPIPGTPALEDVGVGPSRAHAGNAAAV